MGHEFKPFLQLVLLLLQTILLLNAFAEFNNLNYFSNSKNTNYKILQNAQLVFINNQLH